MYKNIHPFFIYFFLAVFIGLLTYATNNLFNLYIHQKNAIKTTGVFEHYTTKTGYAKLTKDRKPIHAPVFNFKTLDGETIKVQSVSFKEEQVYKKGDTVEVFYLKEEPKKAFLKNNYPYKNNIYLFIGSLIGVVITMLQVIKILRA